MSYYYEGDLSPWASGGLLAMFSGLWLFWLAIAIVSIVAMWKIFEKAGEEGWKSIIPFYNLYIYSKIATGTGWWMFAVLVPYIGALFFTIFTSIKMAKAFGKSNGFAVGLIFLNTIFICILAFSSETVYYGPDGQGFGAPGYNPNGYNANGQGGFQNPYSQQYTSANQQGYTANGYNQQATQNQYGTSGGAQANVCPYCGQPVAPGTKFCPSCGKSI